jgi:hypothetical protein
MFGVRAIFADSTEDLYSNVVLQHDDDVDKSTWAKFNKNSSAVEHCRKLTLKCIFNGAYISIEKLHNESTTGLDLLKQFLKYLRNLAYIEDFARSWHSWYGHPPVESFDRDTTVQPKKLDSLMFRVIHQGVLGWII